MPVFEGKPRNKDHVYCWYSRQGGRKRAKQLVRTQRYKLYATGKFFDVQQDPLERSPIEPTQAGEVHAMLQAALGRHRQVTKTADPILQARRAATAKRKNRNSKRKKN